MSASSASMASLGNKHSSRRSKCLDIKNMVDSFLVHRKNSNNLIDLIRLSGSDDDKVVATCVGGFNRIFVQLIENQDLMLTKHVSAEPAAMVADDDKEAKYRVWIKERYKDVKDRLCELLHHDNTSIQEKSLATLMKLLEAEGRHHSGLGGRLKFPVSFLEQILESLLRDCLLEELVITRMQEYFQHDDVRFYAMKIFHKNLQNSAYETDCAEVYLGNVHALLEVLSMPPPPEDNTLSTFLCSEPVGDLKMCRYKEHKKLFTTLWLEFLKCKLPVSVYKGVLVSLHDKVMPHFTNPLLLSDFLTESYNIGGAISLLALNGLFLLVNNFNLDYPDFYRKLYALFQPSVCHAKYRARFFFLADLFLTSTHLSAYLVAAFAKRLSRLSLTAPPSGLVVIIPFIYNLIIRHPGLKPLLHCPDGPLDLTADPYCMEEPDPAKCNALQSSLWEIKTVQCHYHHSIATEAKKIEHTLPTQEIDLSQLLETTTDDLFDVEVKRKLKEVPTTFEPPKGLFDSREDRLKVNWLLE